MPFKSRAQEKWMFANHPRMARRWAAHTPKGKKLPAHVKKALDGYYAATRLKQALGEPIHGVTPLKTYSPAQRAIGQQQANSVQNGPFPYGRDAAPLQQVRNVVGDAVAQHGPEMTRSLSNNFHGDIAPGVAESFRSRVSSEMGRQGVDWRAPFDPNFLGNKYNRSLPPVTWDADADTVGSFLRSAGGPRVSMYPGNTPYSPRGILAHELEHAASLPPLSGQEMSYYSKPQSISDEIPPGIGDVVLQADAARRAGSPLERPVQVLPGVEHSPEWMRQQAAQHGYFAQGGPSMTRLLATPSGQQYLRKIFDDTARAQGIYGRGAAAPTGPTFESLLRPTPRVEMNPAQPSALTPYRAAAPAVKAGAAKHRHAEEPQQESWFSDFMHRLPFTLSAAAAGVAISKALRQAYRDKEYDLGPPTPSSEMDELSASPPANPLRFHLNGHEFDPDKFAGLLGNVAPKLAAFQYGDKPYHERRIQVLEHLKGHPLTQKTANRQHGGHPAPHTRDRDRDGYVYDGRKSMRRATVEEEGGPGVYWPLLLRLGLLGGLGAYLIASSDHGTEASEISSDPPDLNSLPQAPRGNFPLGRDSAANAAVQATVDKGLATADPQVPQIADAYVHGPSYAPLSLRGEVEQQALMAGVPEHMKIAPDVLKDKYRGLKLPVITLDDPWIRRAGGAYIPGKGTVYLPPGANESVIAHELEHAISIPDRVMHSAYPPGSPGNHRETLADELPAVLGDVVMKADVARKFDKPLEAPVSLIVPGGYGMAPETMTRMAREHGYFKPGGPSMTKLLATPAGRAWLLRVLRDAQAADLSQYGLIKRNEAVRQKVAGGLVAGIPPMAKPLATKPTMPSPMLGSFPANGTRGKSAGFSYGAEARQPAAAQPSGGQPAMNIGANQAFNAAPKAPAQQPGMFQGLLQGLKSPQGLATLIGNPLMQQVSKPLLSMGGAPALFGLTDLVRHGAHNIGTLTGGAVK